MAIRFITLNVIRHDNRPDTWYSRTSDGGGFAQKEMPELDSITKSHATIRWVTDVTEENREAVEEFMMDWFCTELQNEIEDIKKSYATKTKIERQP